MRPLLTAVSLLLFVHLYMVLAPGAAKADPVWDFIVVADSVANHNGDDALGDYVDANAILVGAAVAELIEVAIEIGDGGDADGEAENTVLAEKLAIIHKERSGSSVPLELFNAYKSWGDGERATRREAKALEAKSVEARGAGDLDMAVTHLEEALAKYEAIGDRHSQAILYGSLGVVYWYAGDFTAVLENYKLALEWRRAVEDRILEGRTLNGMGSANLQLGDYATAQNYYEQAVDLRRRTGDMSGLGTSLTYLGNSFWYQGRPVEARRAFEEALPVVEAAGNTNQQYELLNSVGVLNAEVYRWESSNEAYRKALALAIADEDPVSQATCHSNLAANYIDAYRFRDARAELDIVEALMQESPDAEQILIFYTQRGRLFLEMGELDRAREDLVEFLKRSREYEAPLHEYRALISTSELYDRLGAYDRAIDFAEKAFVLAEGMEDVSGMRNAAVTAANAEDKAGRYEASLVSWDAALQIDTENGNEANIYFDRLGMAIAKIGLGDMGDAQGEMRDIWSYVSASGDSDMIIALYSLMAHSYEQTRPDSAQFYYEKTLAILEEARADIGGAETQTGFMSGSNRFYYEEIARYYAKLASDEPEPWSDRAFQTVERAKARGLLDLLNNAVLGASSAEEEAILDEMYSLDTQADDYAARESALQARYSDARAARLAEAGASGYGDRSVATIDQIRKALPKNTVMLNYALGDTASLLWVIDRKGSELYQLPPRKALANDVKRLRDALSTPGAGDKALRSSARSLYVDLVAPAAGGRIEKADNLIIVPDGFLFELPFDVLLTSDVPDGTSWQEMPYLARTHATLYAPSATVYLTLRDQRGKGKYADDLLAFGDANYEAYNVEQAAASADLRGGDTWATLPYTRAEVEAIAGYAKEDKRRVYLGDDATEAALKSEMQQGTPRVLHLAAHGRVDPAEPTASAVVLCPDAAGEEDGYLYTLEILSMPMDVGVVVISACESGTGTIGRGEGVVGLSRAFLASGADGIVASLWSVSDESTAQLMDEFYLYMLDKKKPAAIALHEARLALLDNEKFAHPFYWSPFIVTGTDKAPW